MRKAGEPLPSCSNLDARTSKLSNNCRTIADKGWLAVLATRSCKKPPRALPLCLSTTDVGLDDRIDISVARLELSESHLISIKGPTSRWPRLRSTAQITAAVQACRPAAIRKHTHRRTTGCAASMRPAAVLCALSERAEIVTFRSVQPGAVFSLLRTRTCRRHQRAMQRVAAVATAAPNADQDLGPVIVEGRAVVETAEPYKTQTFLWQGHNINYAVRPVLTLQQLACLKLSHSCVYERQRKLAGQSLGGCGPAAVHG